jgi:hypothetical protein
MRLLTGVMIGLLASSAAFAQPHGPMAGGGPHGDDMPMTGMMMGHCRMMQRSEGALAFLKTELKITAAQDKAWAAFAAAYRDQVAQGPKGPMAGRRGGQGRMGPGGGMTMGAGEPFPKAVEQHLQMMERHLAGARKLTDAAKPLYDALGAEQKKTADELLTHFVMMRCAM